MLPTPLPCPFCGEEPRVYPVKPERDGNAWGAVKCSNSECGAQPMVQDGEDIADERGSEAYKKIAIERWNKRHE